MAGLEESLLGSNSRRGTLMLPGAGPESVLVSAAEVKAHCARLLEKLGVVPVDAELTADVFCQSEMMGEESHGFRLVPHLLGRLEAGGDSAETRIATVMDRGAIALWDGQRSLGQVTAARAMRRAMEKAREHGIGWVAVRHSNSFTSAKYYPLIAAEAGMIGCAFTNTSRKMMPPPGGVTPIVGNNPVAYAAPAGKYRAFVLDMASTEAAVERIVQARDEGKPIPPGWALDSDGNDTTDPAKALQSLALLPFGGYKAFGLALVHEMLTSVLAGGPLFAGAATGFLPYDNPMNTSYAMLAIDISAFQPVAEFERRMEEMIGKVKSSRLRDPGSIIRYPGERSFETLARSEKAGVTLARGTLDKLNEWARVLSVPELQPRDTESDIGSTPTNIF
jgi:LDH2 family malate/lactate/ureidoglycolate dehydrogenase